MAELAQRYSRTIASAAALGENAKDRHRFIDKRVLLTGEAPTLATTNGKEIVRAALLLLVRICPNITVALPDECAALACDLKELTHRIDPETRVASATLSDDFEGFDAILSVGTRLQSTLPWTVINSNGWLARVSSIGHDIVGDCEQTNVVGAMGAACLGASEIFKRLIVLTPEGGELLDRVHFSFWDYRSDTDDPGPDLPTEIAVDALLVGAGAIGNGTAYLLGKLPVTGRMTVVDRQDYEEENWGTCLCLSTQDIGHEKAKVLAKILQPKLEVEWKKIAVEDFRKELEHSNSVPRLVLNGLDEIDPRHEVQRLWPDLVIDGAIGSDFSCQVSCHPWGEDVACLICLFRAPHRSEKWEQTVSRASGLPEEFFADLNSIITKNLVDAAPDEKRVWLERHIGKAWCSITPESTAQLLSRATLPLGFSPSVPFVACFSSAMIITELVRRTLVGCTQPQPRFQLNLLWGPQRGTDVPQLRRLDCDCVTRATNINRVRAGRQNLVLK